jgi:hypothetical protein
MATLPRPEEEAECKDVLWQQLEAQFGWYDTAAGRSRLGYQALKVTALVLGATVTVLAAVGASAAVTASLAAAIVVVDGVQQVFKFHSNWISYRATAEKLRQHAVLYVAKATPYDDPRTRRQNLATVVRDLTAREVAGWSTTMRHTPEVTTSTQGHRPVDDITEPA